MGNQEDSFIFKIVMNFRGIFYGSGKKANNSRPLGAAKGRFEETLLLFLGNTLLIR